MRGFKSHSSLVDVITNPERFVRLDRIYGVHRGWCRTDPSDPSSLDPLRRGRIRVFVPKVMPDGYLDENLPWAEPCHADGGGPDRGDFVHPAYNDTVWVMFEGGDDRFPVWMGTWRGSPDGESEIMSEAVTPTLSQQQQNISRYPYRRVTKTRAGHRIELGDDPLELEIRITSSTGNKLVIRDSPALVENGEVVRSPGIRLEDRNGSYIQLDPDLGIGAIYIKGDWHHTVIGDATFEVRKRGDGSGGNYTEVVEGRRASKNKSPRGRG